MKTKIFKISEPGMTSTYFAFCVIVGKRVHAIFPWYNGMGREFVDEHNPERDKLEDMVIEWADKNNLTY
jgi:hypothetical protein